MQSKSGSPLETILSRVGSRVEFMYSQHSVQGRVRGVLLDRIAEPSPGITQPEQFFNVIDLIEFEVHRKKKHVIRFGYYVYRNSRLTWANRSLTDPVEEIQVLFRHACGHRGPDGTYWFKEFIEGCLGNEPPTAARDSELPR